MKAEEKERLAAFVNLSGIKVVVQTPLGISFLDKTGDYKSTPGDILKSVNDLNILINKVEKEIEEKIKKEVLSENDEKTTEIIENNEQVYMYIIKQEDYDLLKEYKNNIVPTNASNGIMSITEVHIDKFTKFKLAEESDENTVFALNEDLDAKDFIESGMTYIITLLNLPVAVLTLGYADSIKGIKDHEEMNSESRVLSNLFVHENFRKEKLSEKLIVSSIADLPINITVYILPLLDWQKEYYMRLGFSEIEGEDYLFAKRETIVSKGEKWLEK